MQLNKIYNCRYEDKINEIGDETIDLVLTDIPYLISRKTRFKGIKDYTKLNGESNYFGMEYEFDDPSFCDIENYVRECCRILKKGGNLIIWSSWQLMGDLEELIRSTLNDKMKEPRTGIWIKSNPMPANIDIKAVNATEMFICVAKGENATFNLTKYKNRILKGEFEINKAKSYNCINDELKNCILEIEDGTQTFNDKYERLIYIEPKVHEKIRIHPTEKPLKIIKHLIETYSNKGDTVFDGLMGSGVTAQASKLLGRDYMGFEINKEYYERAITRLNSRND